MIQIVLGCILRYFPFGPVADFREAISQMVGSQATRIKMVYASLSAPEAPSHSGAALRYIGILGWHLVVNLEYDPQFDGIKCECGSLSWEPNLVDATHSS